MSKSEIQKNRSSYEDDAAKLLVRFKEISVNKVATELVRAVKMEFEYAKTIVGINHDVVMGEIQKMLAQLEKKYPDVYSKQKTKVGYFIQSQLIPEGEFYTFVYSIRAEKESDHIQLAEFEYSSKYSSNFPLQSN